MAISEKQLDTWSHQGSITQSAATYATIKSVLESPSAPYAARSYSIFLQGSYSNDTNIWADSDVDVVICLTDAYHYDIEALTDEHKNAFNAALSPADYGYKSFKTEVLAWLQKNFTDDVQPGSKAIFLKARGNRREADVLVAINHRRYYSTDKGMRYYEGVQFLDAAGTRIINFPKHHSANCTTKHQATANWFKPTVRIVKNLRNHMIGKDIIDSDLAPSYFIEGMIYNVPATNFATNYTNCMVNVLTWLNHCDESTLVCANERFFLLNTSSPVTWRAEKFKAFLGSAIKTWNAW